MTHRRGLDVESVGGARGGGVDAPCRHSDERETRDGRDIHLAQGRVANGRRVTWNLSRAHASEPRDRYPRRSQRDPRNDQLIFASDASDHAGAGAGVARKRLHLRGKQKKAREGARGMGARSSTTTSEASRDRLTTGTILLQSSAARVTRRAAYTPKKRST